MRAVDLFVGRDEELAALVAVLARARQAGPSAALVAGEAGIGKTRLVAEAAATLRDERVRVVRGDAVDDDTPFGLWEGVERALGLSARARGLPPSERRWEVLEGLDDRLRAAGPVAVLLEDLHWADDGSLWVLERLPRQLDGAPVAIVATTRIDEPGTERIAAFRRQATTIELGGLDAPAVIRLAEAVRPGARIDAEGLRRRTGGNPLFVHELLVSTSAATGDRLPPVVSDVLVRSLERLPAETRSVVALLAVAGADTPPTVLAPAAGIEPAVVGDHLDLAVDAGVLRRTGHQVAFRHALLAEAAKTTLVPADRRAGHARLADAWAAVGGPTGQVEAAAHRLAALPVGDADTAARQALVAIEALRSAGDHRRVVDLAGTALAAIDAAGPAAARDRTLLAMARADALDAVGEEQAAVEAYAVAADLARDGDDLELQARAEIGACGWVNPFVPHVERLARLRQVVAALPPGDSVAKVGLLRRAAVLQCSSPGGPRDAIAEGDAAVAMARRLGDPEALVDALVDRHFVPIGADGLDQRAAAAQEVIEIGEGFGRADMALLGYEWHFADRLDHGDLVGAERALDRLGAYAQLMPSPRWTWAAQIRRVVIANVVGDHEDARRASARAAELGAIVGEPGEALGIELSTRVVTTLVWGIEDPGIEPLHERAMREIGAIPAPFLQVVLAMDLWALGEVEEAAAIASRYAGRPDQLVEGVEGSGMVTHLGALLAEAGVVDHAAGLRAVLAPFAGRLGAGNGTGVVLPVDTVLGRLALLLGDVDEAVRNHRDAVAMTEAMPSPTLAARSCAYLAEALAAAGDAEGAASAQARAEAHAGRVGLVLPATGVVAAPGAPATAGGPASLRRDGDEWVVQSRHGVGRVAHATGVEQLARLLARPGVELAATTLAGMDTVPGGPAADLGPALDARAKREYRQRIGDLQVDIDEATANHDPDRAALAQLELDAILAELTNAVGLGGRDRPSGAGAERARVNVTRNVRRAIAAIGVVVPDLGAHLERSVRTGRHCSYSPEPATALTWEVGP